MAKKRFGKVEITHFGYFPQFFVCMTSQMAHLAKIGNKIMCIFHKNIILHIFLILLGSKHFLKMVSIGISIEWRRAVFPSAFFGPLSKKGPFRPKFWKNNFWEHLWSQRGYSRDYFKPNFRSLGPLVSILWALEWPRAGCWSAFFGPLSKKETI